MIGSTDRLLWDRLLQAARDAHQHPDLAAFCAFPDDLVPQDVTAFDIPAARLFLEDAYLVADGDAPLRDAFIACSSLAKWRETYKNTDIGQDFMDRFACYCLIGEGGAFHSDQMLAYMVYMPPHLYYPFHHHPGEELYLTLAGEATFMSEGECDRALQAGQTSQHASNQPHAMETHAHPVMAYVIWRNGFGTPPVLTRK